jgi:hypothetical protein
MAYVLRYSTSRFARNRKVYMNPAQAELVYRERDPQREERERVRYGVLKGIYERAWSSRDRPVRALDIGITMGLSREELFRAVLDLTQRCFLSFCAAGPQVRITQKGVDYLEAEARRRRSIRDS